MHLFLFVKFLRCIVFYFIRVLCTTISFCLNYIYSHLILIMKISSYHLTIFYDTMVI
jgi:hypothetical protein